MGVRIEATVRGYAIFVQDTEGTEGGVQGIVVGGEGEGVVGVEPPMVRVASGAAEARHNLSFGEERHGGDVWVDGWC